MKLLLSYFIPFSICAAVCHSTVQAQSYNALNFDGGNDYVSLSSSTPVPTGSSNYTIEAWFKMNGTTDGGIVGWGNYGTTNQCNALRTANNGTAINNYWWSNDLVKNTGSLGSTWHHVAATYDGSNRCIYLDGTLLGCDQPTNHNVPNANNLRIGSTNNGEYFNGAIDEVRIWNRALCPSELQNNMNGELPNPTTQNGLVAYYRADQGSASGSNSGVTSLTDASGNGNNGTLNNFTLSGSSSNWVAGADSITGTVNQYSFANPGTTSETITKTVSGTTTFSNCHIITTITPSGGGTALSGSVMSKVTVDASVNSYHGQAYVPRHYDIEPATNANTATATLVFYFTQADFTAFNAARGSLPSLPVDATDAANYKANLRITQFHGIPSGNNIPNNYPSSWSGSGPVNVALIPSSVVWNSTDARWEVTCSVTGFSGFFASSSSTPLPVGLIDFSATKNEGGHVLLKWRLAQAEPGTVFFIERSSDAQNFETTGTVTGMQQTDFSFLDRQPIGQKLYYHLRIREQDGAESFSKTESVVLDGLYQAHIIPSPAHDYFTIQSNESLNETAILTDLQGRILLKVQVSNGTRIDTRNIPAGAYLFHIGNNVLRVMIE